MKKIITGIFVASMMLATSAYASLLGSDVELQYYFPNSNSEYSGPQTATVGAGVEFVDFINHFDLDVADSNITAQDFNFASRWTNSSFNGWVLSDINDTVAEILSVTINGLTNMVGFDDSRVSFDENSVSVNWAGLNFNRETIVSLDIEFASVPAPSSMLLMLLGLGMLGASRRLAK